MPETNPSKSVRLSAVCIQHLEAISAMIGDERSKGQIVETLAAGGLRAYMEGVAAQGDRR